MTYNTSTSEIEMLQERLREMVRSRNEWIAYAGLLFDIIGQTETFAPIPAAPDERLGWEERQDG